MKIGVIGCGNISSIYLENLTKRFENTEVVAISDLIHEKALEKAEKFGISRIMALEEMINSREIEAILNITTPKAHYEINKKALLSGKHVYCEKPLCITDEEARAVTDIAAKSNLTVGSAPDTILGAGIQTCKEILDAEEIGQIIGAVGFMTCPGHESWHPDPEFYYQKGGGPLLDMGPYYLTAMTYLIGSITAVNGIGTMPQKTRKIHSGPKAGKEFNVEVLTHINSIFEFENGATGNIIMSFDTWYTHLPYIEIYGSKGTLTVPDPNSFGGPVLIRKAGSSIWKEIPLNLPYSDNSRGLGLSEMVEAIEADREPIASGKRALHVLEVMNAIIDSANRARDGEISSRA